MNDQEVDVMKGTLEDPPYERICKVLYCKRLHIVIISVFGIVMLLLAGCVRVGPDYTPPDFAVSKQWNTELSGGLASAPLDIKTLAGWWSTLNDPMLSSLITRAVEGNLDLRRSFARFSEARARRNISKADRFPTVETSGSAGRSHTSDKTDGSNDRNSFDAGFDAAWEIDFFGGIKRSIEAAEAELEASQEDLRDTMVSLISEVALNYINVRLFQTRLSLSTKSLKAQEETYRLIQWRYEAGLISQLDVEQAKSNLEETRGQIPSLQMELDQALNRLALLLGENPGSIHEELSKTATIPVTSIEVAIGVPAEVLRRIPSVRRAERQLAAQTAKVGVATASAYPKFMLPGSIGLEALSIHDLFSAGSQFLRIGTNFSWIIFDAGSIRQNIKVQNAIQEQSLINYEQAVLTVLEDVENALMAYSKEQVRLQSLKEASQAAQLAEDLAGMEYSSGLIDFQAVLDAQRSNLSLQNQLAVSEGNVTSNLIRLYKALGGGWTSLAKDEIYMPSSRHKGR